MYCYVYFKYLFTLALKSAIKGSRDGAEVRALASYKLCVLGSISGPQCHMWVKFVVGPLPCSKRFFSGYSGFPLSSETNISKIQFDLDYCQALLS